MKQIDREEEACCCSLSNIKFQWHYLKDVRFKALKDLKMRGFLSGIPPRGIPDSCERSRLKSQKLIIHGSDGEGRMNRKWKWGL